jgi:hypothetical protein
MTQEYKKSPSPEALHQLEVPSITVEKALFRRKPVPSGHP